MSLCWPRGCRAWRYHFPWRGERHVGFTHQTRKEDAALRRAYSICASAFDPQETPTFMACDRASPSYDFVRVK